MWKLIMKFQQRFKIEVKLLLSANRKSHMPRQLATQRMTLSDLEWSSALKSTSSASCATRYLCGSWASCFTSCVIVRNRQAGLQWIDRRLWSFSLCNFRLPFVLLWPRPWPWPNYLDIRTWTVADRSRQMVQRLQNWVLNVKVTRRTHHIIHDKCTIVLLKGSHTVCCKLLN